MKISKEISLEDFDAWSGARDTLDELIANGHVADVENILEECYPDGIDATVLNDFLWFECQEQYPEYFDSDEEGEEEDEDEEDF